MTVDLQKIWETESHIIDSGDDPDDASFIGDAAQEQDILNAGENDKLDYWAEADSHIIYLDDPSKENDSFMGTAEDERVLMMREAARHEAQLLGLEEEPSDYTEDIDEDMVEREEEEESETERFSSFETDVDIPYPCEEGVFLPWDGWMRDVNDQIEILDKRLAEKCEKFNREALSAQIRKFMLHALRTKVIQEKFGGEFEPGLFGEERLFFRLDKNLWNEFIDELCLARLDLRRQDWADFQKKEMQRWLERATWDRDFTVGEELANFWMDVSAGLKTEELKRLFNAEVRYDREKDAIASTLDRNLVEACLHAFTEKLNRLKPDFLREKEERERRQAEEERKRQEAERREREERARREAERREREEKERQAEAERKAQEEKEKREKAEAEQKAWEERKRWLKAEAERKAREEAEEKEKRRRLQADPIAREHEITRLRHEWSDADLDMEERIMAMQAELYPFEADLSRCEFDYDSVMTRSDSELEKRSAEGGCGSWTAEDKRAAEASCLSEQIENLREKCGELRENIAHEERKRAIQEKQYEACLRILGASLDPFRMRSFSGLKDILQPDRVASSDTVLPGLPLGMVGCLAGPGGRGKTQLMTQVSYDVACGRNGLTKGAVLFISGEDNREFLNLRRADTLEKMSPKFSEGELADISANFISWSMDGMRADLIDSQSENTRIFMRNLRRIERDIRKKGIQLRLIVFDTLSNFNGGKENHPEQAAAMVEALQRICVATGASLIFLHHTTKASGSASESGADSVRGHSILANNIKCVMLLGGMTEKEASELGVSTAERHLYVKTTLAKCNYLPPREPEWFRNENGVFIPVDLVAPSEAVAEKQRPAETVPSSPASGTETAPVNPEIGEAGNVAAGNCRFKR